jgi:CRP-like cAMP-binding protein
MPVKEHQHNENTAQQSVHSTLGILARFQAVFYAFSFSKSDGVPPSTPAWVTQTVRMTPLSRRKKVFIMNKTTIDAFTMLILNLNSKDTSRIGKIFEKRCLRKGSYFIREGDKSIEMGMIFKGLFRSFYIDISGNDITKYFHAEGCMLFSYAAHLAHSNSRYSIQALEDSEIHVTKITEFENVINGNYELLALYKRAIDEILVKKEEHALSFKLLNGIDRYRAFVAENPGLESRIKQQHLATYLGITPVSLSRIRKKIKINK